MDLNRAEKVFPNFFRNIELPKGAKLQELKVYRFCFYGEINRDAFRGSYEDCIIKKVISNKKIDENSKDPGHYSTSCFEDIKDIRKMKKLFTKHHPETIVAKGITNKECGPCQRTSERIPKRKDSHVDWWIYENSNPEDYFEKIEV